MNKTKRRSFKEIREHVEKVIKRPPTAEQLEDLRNTFVEIDKDNRRKEIDNRKEPQKKIARDPEMGA